MRKTIFKRLMALVMSIVMLATMLPMNVKAESQRIESVYITGVRNTYSAGEHPPFDLKVDPSAPYYIDTEYDGMGYVNGVAWFDYTDGVWLKPESVLKEGHYISEKIRIKAKENYHFYYNAEGAETICYLDNGDELGTHCTSPQTEFTSYTVIGNGSYRVHQATQTIQSITINRTIKKGITLDGIYFNSKWCDGIGGVETVWLRNGATLQAGSKVDFGQYAAVLTISAAYGYKFNWHTVVNIFGQGRRVKSLSSDGRTIKIMTPTIEIKCDHEDDNSVWQNDGDNGLGHYHICSVCGERYDDEEHSFDNGVENGGETTYSCTKCGYQKTLANNNVAITALTINDSALYAGEKPGDVERSLRGSGKLVADITNVRCQLMDPVVWLTDNDEFELGKVYKVELTINAKDGFYFADDCTVESHSHNTESNIYATVVLSNDKKSMTTTLDYRAVKPGSLEIKNPELTPGMSYMDVLDQIDAVSYILGADGGGNSENRNMTISLYEGDAYDAMVKKTTVYHKNTGDQWYRLSDNNEATEELNNGRILADKKYKLELVFGRSGNAANLEVTKENISCDGGNPERSEVNRSDFTFLSVAHLYYQTGSAIVNTVPIESISEPAFGVNPAATEYTLGKTYLLKKGTISWNTDKAFTCDTEDEYKTTINVSTVSDDFDLAAEDAISVFCPEGFTTDSITRVDAHNVRIVLTAPGIEHDYGEWKETKAATCDTMGEKNAECKKCKHVKLGFIDMLEHDWGEWTVVKEATETEEGLKERVCKKNPVHKEQEVIPKKEVTYRTVSFDANGGTGTMAAVKVKNGEKYKLPECGFVPAKGKRFTVWDKGAVGTELTVTADVVVKAQWEDTIFDYKEVTISENKVLTTKDADGEEIALKIEYTGVVSYNGLSHVSQLNKAKKSVVQDVKVDLKCSLSEYATPVITFKNNKSAIVKKAGKEPAFTISFKAKKGATKAQKKVIKAVNKELKKMSFKFALNPMDIGSADKATVKLNKKQTKVTKLILEKGGKKFKLSSKDYSYVINADGSVKITAKEKRNYCGERTVKP